MASAAKAEQAQQLAEALLAILELHREEFPAAQRPLAPPPPQPDVASIRTRHRRQELSGIRFFDRAGRKAAKARAEAATEAEVAAVREQDTRLHAEYQSQLDLHWSRLQANDPDAVMGALAEAFEDNEAAAAPVGVTSDQGLAEASMVVLVPGVAAVPERKPTTTVAGNLSLKKLTKRESADFYKLLVCGYVLATVKEAFAVAPGLAHVRVVALRDTGKDSYGASLVEAVLGARFSRKALEGVQWSDADASMVVNDTSEELTLEQFGPSKALAALDLKTEPDIAAVVSAVDIDDLTN